MNRSRRPLLVAIVAAASLAAGGANPTAIVKLAVFPTSNSPTTTCSISISGHLGL